MPWQQIFFFFSGFLCAMKEAIFRALELLVLFSLRRKKINSNGSLWDKMKAQRGVRLPSNGPIAAQTHLPLRAREWPSKGFYMTVLRECMTQYTPGLKRQWIHTSKAIALEINVLIKDYNRKCCLDLLCVLMYETWWWNNGFLLIGN